MKNWPGRRIGVVGGPGDRRDDDFITLGKLAAQMFDELIIKEDDDTRGADPRGDAAKMDYPRRRRSRQSGQLPHHSGRNGKPSKTALDEAPEGGLVVILPESVTRSINLINARNPLPDPQIYRRQSTPPKQKAEAGTAEESDKFGLRPICRSSPVNLRSGQLPIADILSNFPPSWEGCPEGGVGQIYDYRYPIYHGIKRLKYPGLTHPCPSQDGG